MHYYYIAQGDRAVTGFFDSMHGVIRETCKECEKTSIFISSHLWLNEKHMSDFKTIFQNYKADNNLQDDPIQDQTIEVLNACYIALQKPIKKGFFKTAKPIKGIYLWGGVGRGKTMIMDLFYDALPIDQKLRVHFNIFMMDVHSNIKLLREDGQGKDPLQSIARDIADKTRLLCFDEFQVYDIADAMVLSELFKHLFHHGVCVIATSNVAPDNLYKDGLQRSRFLPFIPLVKKHMHVCHLDSPTDYRQQAIREDGVYFIQNKAKMDALFAKLTFPHQSKPIDFKIGKRDIHIEKSIDSFAWLSFAELCEKPRGVPDYKALSEAYKTVFIHNIPRMGYDRRNELKRFIILIDTLYDAQCRVVINAETEPQKLYHGKDHAFEFERTISRLLEMQGEDYLSKTNDSKIDKI
jgi:cell division protein ZapE